MFGRVRYGMGVKAAKEMLEWLGVEQRPCHSGVFLKDPVTGYTDTASAGLVSSGHDASGHVISFLRNCIRRRLALLDKK